MPPGVVAVMSTVLGRPAGAVAVSSESLTTVTAVAGAVPKSTTVVPVKPVPSIVTEFPPATRPADGLTLETVGTAMYVNWSPTFAAVVPFGVVTVTSTTPVAPAGACAVIVVALTTVTAVAADVPKCTAVAPVKFVPVIVTGVPPVTEPNEGLMLAIVGAGR